MSIIYYIKFTGELLFKQSIKYSLLFILNIFLELQRNILENCKKNIGKKFKYI